MIWATAWSTVARRDLLEIPWRTAARFDAAVMRFAQTGRGPVDRVSPADPRRLQIVVPGAMAYLFADEHTGILRVGRAFNRSPR